MTNALCKNTLRDIKAWSHVVELAISRNVPLIPVVLEATSDELVRRVQSAERVGKKLTDPAELRSYFDVDTIQCPAVPELLILDVTDLRPEDSAARIEDHLTKISGSLAPAGRSHLQLR